VGHVEATETVEAPREEVFHFTDWCYDDPEWAPFITKAWIVKLPGPDGLAMISHYAGRVMGRELEWEGESVKWRRNEFWTRKALSGPLAKMSMQMEMRFETAGTETKVTSRIDYKVPYPLAGWLIDRLYMRRQARKMVNDVVDGIKKAVMERRIPTLQVQLEKRKVDHPGYNPP
jgi:uncharacterized membrane protein